MTWSSFRRCWPLSSGTVGEFCCCGEPQLTRAKFNVGNVHVVEEHTEKLLAFMM
jgi:hypothetical protein